jgi:hypothetical protein
MQQHTDPNPNLVALQRKALVVGVIGLVVLLGGGVILGIEHFFQSYLYGFLFWNGLGLGCLSALMLHHMVAGRWGFMIQRILEAGARNLLFTVLLILPILFFGMKYLYPWMPNAVETLNGIEHGHHKAEGLIFPILNISWYNQWFFIARSVIYYAVWIALMMRLTSLSAKLDATGDQTIIGRFRGASAPGLLFYVITMTFAACDWGMSLEPEWFSTIYGPLYVVGQGLGTLAFSVIILNKIADDKPHAPVIKTDYFHHLGSLMCAFIVLWTYIQFSQFLITYSGNLPEEIPWYLHRQGNFFAIISVALMIFHFFLPLFILMQRRVKRARRGLLFMAKWILIARFVDVFWIIIPAFHPHGDGYSPAIFAMNVGALAGIGGIWVYLFVRNIHKHPLLPLNDDRMNESLGIGPFAHEEAHEHA